MKRENLVNQTFHRQFSIGVSAASAAQSTDIIDLGQRHNFREIVGIKRGAPSAGETLLVWQSFDGDAETPTWALAPKADLSGFCSSPASAAIMVASAAPAARWIKLVHTNGETAQTALSLEFTAYPAG